MKIKVCIAAAAASCCASAQFGLTWSDAYNGTASGQDRGRVIAVDKRGNTYVAGSSAWPGIQVVSFCMSPSRW